MSRQPAKRSRNRREDASAIELPAELNYERALDESQTSAFFNVARITLSQWRARGQGPRFFRMGRSIRYRLGDLIAFRDANTVGDRSDR